MEPACLIFQVYIRASSVKTTTPAALMQQVLVVEASFRREGGRCLLYFQQLGVLEKGISVISCVLRNECRHV